MSSTDNILALLQKKPQPKKKEIVRVVIAPTRALQQQVVVEEAPENVEASAPEKELKEPEKVEQGIVIRDVSKTSNFNRTAFLNKLQENTTIVKKPVMTVIQEEEATIEKPVLQEPALQEPVLQEPVLQEPVLPVEQPVLEPQEFTIIPKPKGKRAPAVKREGAVAVAAVKKPFVQEGPLSMIKIGDTPIGERLGEKEELAKITASPYYMSNRSIYTNYISTLFEKYKKELIAESKNASCSTDDESEEFKLMTHQKIVRDYINLYTPYRGLLLYHGLGSGKTCSSIAIAEGMKSNKQVIVMTPASLQVNYIEELKKCGDMMYRKNQFWEFVSTRDNPQLIEILSNILSLSVEYIRRMGGAWLVNIKKPANFESLKADEQKSLDKQIYEMIKYKYKFINYNGLRKSHLGVLTDNGKINPFDNKVVIIDEAHNFVSRIVNKLRTKETTLTSLSGQLYNYLMEAKNVKIILLTGTPIINYPNEIAILFNILRGKINTWLFKLVIEAGNTQKINEEYLTSLFKSTLLGGNIMDYLSYRPAQNILAITRNPFGFVNQTEKQKYKGVRIGERGEMDDNQFIEYVIKILGDNNIGVKYTTVKNDITGKKEKNYEIAFESYKALPDSLDEFKTYFIDERNELINPILLKRRILGLTSYFRSAQENLMPKYDKSSDFRVIRIPMSEHQFRYYELERIEERKREAKNAMKKKKNMNKGIVLEDSSSTYRIFSRALCNFVFPYPDIPRPKPVMMGDAEISEDILDVATNEDKINNVDGLYEAEDVVPEPGAVAASTAATGLDTTPKDLVEYDQRIKMALEELEKGKEKYFSPEGLKTYSPKFLAILNNLLDENNEGLHLIYSQFRTLEGIGILKLVLEANGFAQFKIVKEEGTEVWKLAIKEEDMDKPKFVLYTGTESAEEKELVRNIFNGKWKYVPASISRELLERAPNNNLGEIIKIFMITSSGAEGISLKNVRFVHITEPYWHPVRMEQVIGRARRICSHQDLPPELRTVFVFVYLMTLSADQLTNPEALNLRKVDVSKIDNKTPMTSDEALFEISNIKEGLTLQILKAVKESSFDCTLHSSAGNKEKLNCFSYGTSDSSKFISLPSILEEDKDEVFLKNKTTDKIKAVEIMIDGIQYAYDKETNNVYNLDTYKAGDPVQVGNLILFESEGKQKYRFVPTF
jgi:hypothetical protein